MLRPLRPGARRPAARGSTRARRRRAPGAPEHGRRGADAPRRHGRRFLLRRCRPVHRGRGRRASSGHRHRRRRAPCGRGGARAAAHAPGLRRDPGGRARARRDLRRGRRGPRPRDPTRALDTAARRPPGRRGRRPGRPARTHPADRRRGQCIPRLQHARAPPADGRAPDERRGRNAAARSRWGRTRHPRRRRWRGRHRCGGGGAARGLSRREHAGARPRRRRGRRRTRSPARPERAAPRRRAPPARTNPYGPSGRARHTRVSPAGPQAQGDTMTMPLRLKLAGLGILAATSMLVVGGMGVRTLRMLTHVLDAADVARTATHALGLAGRTQEALRADVLAATHAGTDAEAVAVGSDVGAHARAFEAQMAEAAGLPLPAPIHALLVDARPSVERYTAAATTLVALATVDRAAAGRQLDPFLAIFHDLETRLEEIGTATDGVATKTGRDASTLARSAVGRLLALTLAMLVLVAVSCRVVLRGLTASIDSLVHFAVGLADGRLDRRLPVAGTDGIMRLSLALNTAAARLQSALASDRVVWTALGDTVRRTLLAGHMVESAPIAIIHADGDGCIRHLNPAARRLLDRWRAHLPLPATDPIGQPLAIICGHATDGSGSRPRETEMRIGSDTVSVRLSPIVDDEQRCLGTMAILAPLINAPAERRRAPSAGAGDAARSTVPVDAQALVSAAADVAALTSRLSTDATEASARSSELGRHAAQVRDSVETVAGRLDRMEASIREITQDALRAAATAAQAVMAADATRERVERLDGSSGRISGVVEAITAIAHQTNMLALNATIEAARAGDPGRGFIVVANDVKNLAQETARATGEVSRMIDDIQRESRAAVAAIDAISTTIARVNDMSAAVASAVEEQSAAATEMARTAAQAAEGTAQITGGIEQLSGMAAGPGSGISAGFAQLAGLASRLRDLSGSGGPTPGW